MHLIKIIKDKNYIIKTGGLIDDIEECSNPTTPCPERCIYLENGQIAATTNTGDASYKFTWPTRPTISLDLGNLTVLPPLVDCHIHLALDGRDFSAARRRWEQPDELYTQVSAQLRDTVRHGILAVRDGGDRPGITLRFRELVSNNALTGPLIRASGYALRKPQKYGSFLGRGIPTEMLDSTLKQLARQGVDQIKVLVSGVVSFKEYSRVGPLQYTAKELTAIVQGAHNLGLCVMAHASSDEAVAMAVKAGVDTVEHGYFLSRDTMKQMAEKGTAWIPTVIPVAAQLDGGKLMETKATEAGGRFSCFHKWKQENRPPASASYPPKQDNNVIAKTVDRQLAMINEAHALGVTLGVGTDSGASRVRHGYSYWQELTLYQEAGLPPREILRCATINSARILGLNWGRIAPGRPAAMIAVAGNPLEDITNLRNIEYVFQPV